MPLAVILGGLLALGAGLVLVLELGKRKRPVAIENLGPIDITAGPAGEGPKEIARVTRLGTAEQIAMAAMNDGLTLFPGIVKETFADRTIEFTVVVGGQIADADILAFQARRGLPQGVEEARTR